MTDHIIILIDGRPVIPTTLRLALLPLAWLFMGFAALGFVSTVAERSSLGLGILVLAILASAFLAARHFMHTHDYDPVTEECTQCLKAERTSVLERLWSLLKAEWAICWKQADCPHLDADWNTMEECPDCRYRPMFEVIC